MLCALVAALVLAVTACGGGGAGQGSDGTANNEGQAANEDLGSVTLAVPVPSAYYMVPFLSEELGLFEENGVEVDVRLIEPGSLSPALAGGRLEFGLLPGPVVEELRLGGADVVYLANYIDKPMVSLVAQPGVSDVAALRGETVAVGVPTSLSTIFMKEELAASDVAMDDVQTRVIASQPAQLSALLSGQVSATMLSIPQTFVAEERGMKVLKDLGASDEYAWPFAGIVTRSSYAEENREQTVAVLRGIVGGIRAWKENPEAAKEVIRRETKLEEGVLVDRSYEAVSEALEERPIPTEQLVSVPLETLAREGNEKAADADPGRSFDDRYIREALR